MQCITGSGPLDPEALQIWVTKAVTPLVGLFTWENGARYQEIGLPELTAFTKVTFFAALVRLVGCFTPSRCVCACAVGSVWLAGKAIRGKEISRSLLFLANLFLRMRRFSGRDGGEGGGSEGEERALACSVLAYCVLQDHTSRWRHNIKRAFVTTPISRPSWPSVTR